jgi:hypothetical protein
MPRQKSSKKTNGDVTVAPVPSAAPAIPPVETSVATAVPVADIPKAARKPAIVRNESRANLFPINVDEEIRRLAYLLSERRGFEPGHESEDWLTAEREVRQRYHQQSA